MSVNEKMTAIADEIRELSGTTEAMGLDAMANNVSNANIEIANQEELLAEIASALEEKIAGGANEPDSYFAVEQHFYTYDSSDPFGGIIGVEFFPFKSGMTWGDYLNSPLSPIVAVEGYMGGIETPIHKFYYSRLQDNTIEFAHFDPNNFIFNFGDFRFNGEVISLDQLIIPYDPNNFEATKYMAAIYY